MGARETFNVISHMIGAALAAGGTVALAVRAMEQGAPGKAGIVSVFGLTAVLAFVASILFHGTRGEARERFRRLDRIAIYLLIVGGYAVLCLLVLPPRWGWPLLLLAGILAVAGVVAELRTSRLPARHSVSLYLVLGWMALAAIKPLIAGLTPAGFAWLLAGGLLYTLGAVVVRFRVVSWDHETWHVAVLGGSACHFIVVFNYVV